MTNGFPLNAMDAYRVVYPLRAMETQGHRTEVMSLKDLQAMAFNQDSEMLSYDIYMFSRLLGDVNDQKAFADFLEQLRQLGKTVIVDYDDDYTNIHRVVHDGALGGLQNASALSTSTEYLRQVMKPYCKEVFVAKNLIVPELFNKFPRIFEPLVIGLTGSVTHIKDWQAVYEPLTQVLSEHPEVRIFCSGLVPDVFKGHPQLLTLRDLVSSWDPDAFVQLRDYGLIHRNIDILLCPVDPADKFNWSKSNLKAIEGQASLRDIDNVRAGSFVIATKDLPIYRDAIVHGQTGLLVNHLDKVGWYSSLKRAISDVEFRKGVQKAGYQSCMTNFNIHTKVVQRVAALRHIRAMDLRSFHRFMAAVAASAQAPALRT